MLCLLQCLQQLERKLRHRASESRSDSEQISPRLLEKGRVCTLKPDALYINGCTLFPAGIVSFRKGVENLGEDIPATGSASRASCIFPFGMVRQSSANFFFSFPSPWIEKEQYRSILCVDYRFCLRYSSYFDVCPYISCILVDQRTDSMEEFKRQYFVNNILSIALALLSINGFDEN